MPDSYSAPPTCLSSSAQSASYLCSSSEQKSFDYFYPVKKPDQTSHSSNDSSFQDFDSISKIESIVEEKPVEVMRTLIPLNDNVGELILISEDQISQDVVDSDDEKEDNNFLNINFKEPFKAEDIETVLNSLEEVKDINSRLKTKLVSLAQRKKEENSKLQSRLQTLTRLKFFFFLIKPFRF